MNFGDDIGPNIVGYEFAFFVFVFFCIFSIFSIFLFSPLFVVMPQYHLEQQTWSEEKKNYAHTLYWHECEPIIQMLNMADHVVAWGVMPLLRGGLC